MQLSEADVAAAVEVMGFWLPAGLVVHDSADAGLSSAMLALPRKRQYGRFDAGVLALCAAWWAGREQPRAAVV